MSEEVCDPPARVEEFAVCWKVAIRIEQIRDLCPPLGQRIRTGADVWEISSVLIPADEREHFLVYLLDGRNHIKAYAEVSIGTLTAAIVHPRDVFRPALLWGAAAVVVAHNHPSGDPSPSAEDLAVTARLREAGQIIGITLLDHVIVGNERYFSFLERGYFETAGVK